MSQMALKVLDYLEVYILYFLLEASFISTKNPPCSIALTWKYLVPIHNLLNFLFLVELQNNVIFMNNSFYRPLTVNWRAITAFVICLIQLNVICDNLRKNRWLKYLLEATPVWTIFIGRILRWPPNSNTSSPAIPTWQWYISYTINSAWLWVGPMNDGLVTPMALLYKTLSS